MINPVLPAYYPTFVQNVNGAQFLTPAERAQQQDQIGLRAANNTTDAQVGFRPLGLGASSGLFDPVQLNDTSSGLLSQLRNQTITPPLQNDTGLLSQSGTLSSLNAPLNLNSFSASPLDNLSTPLTATGLNGSLGNSLVPEELGPGFVSSGIGQYSAVGANDITSAFRSRGLLDLTV